MLTYCWAALQIEWAKCRSRAARWHEELRWLKEEMRRVLEFGDWKEQWWMDRVAMRTDGDPALMEGLRAYAFEHADIEHRYSEMLIAKWANIQQRAQVVLDDLSSRVFSETPVEGPLVVDIEYDLEDDANGGSGDGDWPRDQEEEEEEIA